MKITHKRLEIDPNEKTFGEGEFKQLAKLMNWYTGEGTTNIKKIIVNIDVISEDNETINKADLKDADKVRLASKREDTKQ